MKVEFQMKNDRSDPQLQFVFMNDEQLDLNINGQRMADIMEDLEELSWDMVNNKKVKNPEMDVEDEKHDIPLPC
jgi:hypothetical protein